MGKSTHLGHATLPVQVSSTPRSRSAQPIVFDLECLFAPGRLAPLLLWGMSKKLRGQGDAMLDLIGYFAIFVTPAAVLLALGKSSIWIAVIFGLAFIAHPILDWATNRFGSSRISALPSHVLLKLPLYLCLPVQALLFSCAR